MIHNVWKLTKRPEWLKLQLISERPWSSDGLFHMNIRRDLTALPNA